MRETFVFKNKVLFIEFFVRVQRIYEKGTSRTKLSPHSAFYTGASKAKHYRNENTPPPLIAFEKDIPYLSENMPAEMFSKILKKLSFELG